MLSKNWMFGLFVSLMFAICWGCGGKDKNPLSPEPTLGSYAQTEKVVVSAASKPAVVSDQIEPSGKKQATVIAVVKDASGLPFNGYIVFYPSISGRRRDSGWSGEVKNGDAVVGILNPRPGGVGDYRDVSGYYYAQLFENPPGKPIKDADWQSIPINGGKITNLILQVGRQAQIVIDEVVKPRIEIVPSSDYPAGILPSGAVGAPIARFDLYAYGAHGGDIRINNLTALIPPELTTAHSRGLHSVTVWLRRVQIGSTNNIFSTPVMYAFGTVLVVHDSSMVQIEFRADVKTAEGYNYAAKTMLAIDLAAGENNARVLNTNELISTPAVKGRPLMVENGVLTVTKDDEVPDGGVASPNGAVDDKRVSIGSFVIEGGVSEDSDISVIQIADDVGPSVAFSLGDGFNNLYLESAATGIRIGATVANLNQGHHGVYEFTASPAIKLESKQKMRVRIYADPRLDGQFDGINNDPNGIVMVQAVKAVGTFTQSSTTGAMTSGLQRVYIKTPSGIVLPESGEILLTLPIDVKGDFSLSRSGVISGFSVSRLDEDDPLVVDVSFRFRIAAWLKSVRMVFYDVQGGILHLTSDQIKENSVRFQKPWAGSFSDKELLGLEVERRSYGRIVFFGRPY
ncbi:hypothetical protein HY411_01395 [Candidatus Gottesmanbacteria bacterium]|nr:hypothetical protein [Candidatus Gottesmanbacteria bacterium]